MLFFFFFRIIKNNSVAAFQRRVFFIPSTPSRRVAQLKITIGSFQIRAALCSNDGGQVVLTPAPQTAAIYFIFPHCFPALFMVWENVDLFFCFGLKTAADWISCIFSSFLYDGKQPRGKSHSAAVARPSEVETVL